MDKMIKLHIRIQAENALYKNIPTKAATGEIAVSADEMEEIRDVFNSVIDDFITENNIKKAQQEEQKG